MSILLHDLKNSTAVLLRFLITEMAHATLCFPMYVIAGKTGMNFNGVINDG